MCSGWVWYWGAYCHNWFEDAPLPPMYGTCFDLADCPGDCRHLEDVWWACKRYTLRGYVNCEIYCADDQCCPIGEPLAGVYGQGLDWTSPWQHFVFGGVPLCACEEQGAGKFIVMITDPAHQIVHQDPLADINYLNIDVGCESDWRCSGHSFVYRNAISYCEVYGAPGPMWAGWGEWGCTDPPAVPPGCHQTGGFYCEWLIECYISCQGATAADRTSWSEVKRLYR